MPSECFRRRRDLLLLTFICMPAIPITRQKCGPKATACPHREGSPLDLLCLLHVVPPGLSSRTKQVLDFQAAPLLLIRVQKYSSSSLRCKIQRPSPHLSFPCVFLEEPRKGNIKRDGRTSPQTSLVRTLTPRNALEPGRVRCACFVAYGITELLDAL